MQKNLVIALFIGVVVIIGVIFLLNKPSSQPTSDQMTAGDTMPVGSEVENPSEAAADSMVADSMMGEVKEFSMDSWYDPEAKKAHFSLSEIVVNQGDKVRVKVTNTFGKHDFKIDELNVFAETPQGETTVIEFTASEAGEFVFYCSKPGHRASGQWGTLKVLGS